ncbi:hypothetical protein AAFF_G00300490 [Aldrovandia affinis]|uniref:Uncharacterized protein n=1 Tax=Aldrovandia affinis TaxID=143900 RepID=A0AAD7SPP3_9TELE|nr:hypothetical protein AAFF_G00300490 [Aldrovandia affinis]
MRTNRTKVSGPVESKRVSGEQCPDGLCARCWNTEASSPGTIRPGSAKPAAVTPPEPPHCAEPLSQEIKQIPETGLKGQEGLHTPLQRLYPTAVYTVEKDQARKLTRNTKELPNPCAGYRGTIFIPVFELSPPQAALTPGQTRPATSSHAPTCSEAQGLCWRGFYGSGDERRGGRVHMAGWRRARGMQTENLFSVGRAGRREL